MKKILLLLLASILLVIPVSAERVVITKYRTAEAFDKVFESALHAALAQKYVIKSVDKNQGTIQAAIKAWGSAGEAASLFILIKQSGDDVYLEATFTRSPGVIGGSSSEKRATRFGVELKKAIPDLTTT